MRGRFVSLAPLTTDHAAALCAGADAQTVEFLARGGPQTNTPEQWAAYIERLNGLPHRVNWAVLGPRGEVLGRISYSEVRPADRWAEIGTMLLPAGQGTFANPEAKLLLLTRAFELLGAGRVKFKVDTCNARSLRAMDKLGAVREGTLRHAAAVSGPARRLRPRLGDVQCSEQRVGQGEGGAGGAIEERSSGRMIEGAGVGPPRAFARPSAISLPSPARVEGQKTLELWPSPSQLPEKP